jgi:hypothetical protein
VVILAGCLLSLNEMTGDRSAAAANVRSLHEDEPGPAPDLTGQVDQAVRTAHRITRQFDAATWLGIALAVASCGLCAALFAFRRRLSFTWVAVLLGLLVLDLGAFSAGTLQYSTYDAMVVRRPEYVRFLQENLGLQRYMCWRGPEDATNRHRGMLWRIRHGMSGPGGIFHTPRQSQFNGLVFSGRFPRLLHLAGVRYLVMSEGTVPPDTAVQCRDGPVSVVENPSAMARAFLARQTAVVEDANLIIGELAAGKTDLADVAFLEQPVEALPPVAGPRDAGETLSIDQPEPSRYVLRTQAPAPRQLVLTETYHPEWTCTIDGQRTEVHLTDYTFMSVRVPAGEHAVEFRYEPASFNRGLLVTAVACAALVGAMMTGWLLNRGRGRLRDHVPSDRTGT